MAKRKVREMLNGRGPHKHTYSSGVEVEILPFPAGLWEDLNAKAFQEFPDPEPPTKEIKTVDGTEEVPDTEDPDYKAQLAEASRARTNLLGEAALDLCVMVDLDRYESVIKRLEKYSSEPWPDDPEDRRVEFLTRYALRTKGDYEATFITAVEQMMIGDPEVAQRLRTFQSEVERAAADRPDASGPDEGERVEV